MLVVVGIEVVLLGGKLTVDGACHVVARVAYRLQLAHLAQHGAYLALRLVREVGVAHALQVFGYLYLHIVGDAFVFLNPREELVVGCLVLLLLVGGRRRQVQQLLHHTEHALHTLRERCYLLLSLQDRKLRCAHEARCDEVQAEVFFLVHALGLDNPADETLYLRHKPYEDERVGNIEAGMEGGQHKAQLGGIGQECLLRDALLRHRYVVAYQTADQVDERAEYHQYPHHTEEVEEHVRQGGSACLCVG